MLLLRRLLSRIIMSKLLYNFDTRGLLIIRQYCIDAGRRAASYCDVWHEGSDFESEGLRGGCVKAVRCCA